MVPNKPIPFGVAQLRQTTRHEQRDARSANDGLLVAEATREAAKAIIRRMTGAA